mgnify:CR=1 FL=1
MLLQTTSISCICSAHRKPILPIVFFNLWTGLFRWTLQEKLHIACNLRRTFLSTTFYRDITKVKWNTNWKGFWIGNENTVVEMPSFFFLPCLCILILGRNSNLNTQRVKKKMFIKRLFHTRVKRLIIIRNV